MSGSHSRPRTPRPRHARSGKVLPIASAAVATAILAGGAFAGTKLNFDADDPLNIAADRSAESAERVSRDLQRPLPSLTPSASASPSALPSVSPTPSTTVKPSPAASRTVVSSGSCEASFYDEPQGTANGETFDPNAMTAAHKTLAFNSRVLVTNLANGKSVVVRINDRGPYVSGRCLDLSRAAFAKIASLGAGHVSVKYEVLG